MTMKIYHIFVQLAIIISLSISSTAQERLFTDKETGGSDGGIVGSIDADFEVTPTGQFRYEIPVPTVPGTGGMAPILTISYDSSTKDGLLGYGFDLKGLSIIHRVPSNYYIDGFCPAVNFTASDHLALDGVRLIECTSFNNGKIEYRTEQDSHSKITAYGDDRNNPTSIIVQTQSGIKYEYSPINSILTGAYDKSLFWLVTKVSDTKGNYFTVNYSGDGDTNDFRVSRIDYTGNDNASLVPYASIRFEYTDNAYSPTSYIYGQKVKKSKIISSIKTYYENKLLRTISLQYSSNNFRNQLSKITESESGGQHKNPTRFTWYNPSEFKVTKVDYTTSSGVHKALISVGDFNGDGKDDFIATPDNKDAGWTGWRLYLREGDHFSSPITGSFIRNQDEVGQVECGDYNGDGLCDIVVKRNISSGYHNCDLYLSNLTESGVTFKYFSTFASDKNDFSIRAIETHGDGAADIFLWYHGSAKYKIFYSGRDASSVNPLQNSVEKTIGDKFDRVEYGDFNGDGLTDVMNLNNDGYRLYESNGYGLLAEVKTGTWPEKRHFIKMGDFNGDGKTDMLLTGWENNPNAAGWSEWAVCYSKGNSEFERVYVPKSLDTEDRELIIADINGDGLDDFQAIDKKSSGTSMTKPSVYLNDGNGNFKFHADGGNVYAMDKWRFYTGDFNGDGKIDMLCTSNWEKSNWDGFQLYLMPESHNSLLSGVTDGMGNAISVAYKYMSDPSVCGISHDMAYPLVSFGTSWPVVSTVSTPDGIGGKHIMEYTYGSPIFHKAGRGFLSFSSFTEKDATIETSTTSTFGVLQDKLVSVLSSTQSHVGDRIIAYSEYTNSIIPGNWGYNNSKIFSVNTDITRNIAYEYNTGDVTSDITTTYQYDKFGNITKSESSSGDVKTTVTNTYVNDATNWIIGRLTEAKTVKTKSGVTSTKTVSFSYDGASGLLTEEVIEPGNMDLGLKKTYIHDQYGNIISSSLIPLDGSDSRTTLSTYDSKGRFVTSTTNSLGFTQTFTIDDGLGLALESTDANGIKTTNTYGSFGTLEKSSDPIETSVQTIGWSNGMEDAPETSLYFTYSKSTGSPYSIEFYDCLGRTVRTVTQSVKGKKVYVDVVYNNKGQTARSSEPYFRGETVYWNTVSYDKAGRTICQTDASGNSNTIDYRGLSTITTDASGSKITRTANLNGNLVRSVDNAGTEILYEYDPEGRCVEVRCDGKTTSISYDILGNRIMLDDPDSGTVISRYNAYGEVISKEDEYGKVNFFYDAGGRLIQEGAVGGYGIRLSYDSKWKGSLDESVYTSDGYSCGKIYHYDDYGRISSESTLIDRTTFTSYITYNSENKVEQITYPTGVKVRNTYEDCGALSSVTDVNSGVTYWSLVSINARGQVEQEKLGNRLVTTTEFDEKRGIVKSIKTPGIQDWEYSFDAVGNLTSRKDLKRNLTESFYYDDLHRLVRVAKNGSVIQTMTYDAVGNITSKSDVGNYGYEAQSNRLVTISDYERQPKVWDEIMYTDFGKISYIKSGSSSMAIEYGPDKSCFRKTIGDEMRYYVGKLFEEHDDARNVTNYNYIMANGKNVAIVIDRPEKDAVSVWYIHHDHLGSVQAYSDKDGNLIQELSYDAWGMRRDPGNWNVYYNPSDADAIRDYGFGGHEHMDLFCLVDMGGRIYDPFVGRFLSPDPIVQLADYPSGLNRYAYCLNNPLSLVDPTGYSWLSKNWKSIVASVVGITVSAVTLGSGTSVGVAIIAGAAGGAASALTGALLNGANFGQIAKNTLIGATLGAAGGFLNFASADPNIIESLLRHSFSQGWLEGIQGGNFVHGFMMGSVSKGGGSFIDTYCQKIGQVGKLIADAILSGIVDELGGGKFANGAITGAYSYLFNETLHTNIWYRDLKKIFDKYKEMAVRFKENSLGFYSEIGGPLGQWAMDEPDKFSNTCAAKLSYALNYSGFEIPDNTPYTYKGEDNKNYFINAAKMTEYLKKTFKQSYTKPINVHDVKNSIIYQIINKKGVSGHVDVIFKDVSASGSKYEYDTYIIGK